MEKSSFHARSSLRKPEVSTVFSQVSSYLDVFVSSQLLLSLYSVLMSDVK